MHTFQGYRVVFLETLPPDKGLLMDNTIYVPETLAYKFMFMNNQVNEQTVQFAIDHAIRKVHRFIDNL